MFGGRSFGAVLRAVGERRHYRAAANMVGKYSDWPDAFYRYLTGKGRYPHRFSLKHCGQIVVLTAYHADDLLTINEVFCRIDYPVECDDLVFVDIGANIGIVTAYFLSSSPDGYVYAFEPVSRNCRHFRENTASFADRINLVEAAVGLEDTTVEFGIEETGRYGGIGVQTGSYVRVPCLDIKTVIKGVLGRHCEIDLLKIDVEGLEESLVQAIGNDDIGRIKKIYAEYDLSLNPFPQTHRLVQDGKICKLIRLQRNGQL